MRPLTILVSAAGCPGSAALFRALRENGEREVRLVGTDMAEQAVGRHLCDAFHRVPAGTDPGFADAMLAICRDEGVQATYFLMARSVFYNLLSPGGEAAFPRLRELGHAVGLHGVYPHADLDPRFDPVLAWHNPVPETMTDPVPGVENVMCERFFARNRYRSDSNAHWRSGCPHEELANRELEWLQLLTHPEIWVYPGASMGETMRSMLDAWRERDLERLAADRIELG